MKSSRYMGVKSQKLMEAPVPTCGENDILCKTIYCGICGSDIAGYFHGSDFFWEDCDWGHEPVCEVVEVGKNVSGIHAGERVFPSIITGGFGEYFLVQNAELNVNVFKIDGLSDETAVLIEPLCVGYHAAKKLNPPKDAKVVVFGAGIIGLSTAIFLKFMGAKVLLANMTDFRLEAAKKFGILTCNSSKEDVEKKIREEFGVIKGVPFGKCTHFCDDKLDVDGYVEATGAGPVMNTIMNNAKRGANIVVVSMHHAPRALDLQSLTFYEMTIQGSQGFLPSEIAEVIEILQNTKEDFSALVTNRFAIEDMEKALNTANDENISIKTVISFK